MVRKYVPTMGVNDPQRVIPPRRQQGRPPNPEQGPIVLADIHVEAEHWRLAYLHYRVVQINPRTQKRERVKPIEDDSEWLSLKLYVVGSVIHKANYWISWHPDQCRFAARGDRHALGELRADLLAASTAVMQAVSDLLRRGANLHALPPLVYRAGAVIQGVTEEEQAIRELMPKIAALQVGQTLFTLEPRAVVYWAVHRMQQTGPKFKGEASPLGGWDVTRLS